MSAIRVLCDERDDDFNPDAIACAASEYFALEGDCEAELVFCDGDEIRAANRDNRGVDSVTDVLSFPFLDLTAGSYPPFTADNFCGDADPQNGSIVLGSVMICREVAVRQAAEYGHSVGREKGYLFLHGLLHLLGFDHMCDEDKTAMRLAEEEILNKVGLARS